MSHLANAAGTERDMDTWLNGSDRSDLFSDEGPQFGNLGSGEWEMRSKELREWLVREN